MTDYVRSDYTVHVAIGNTDNRLSQQEWHGFYAHVDALIASVEQFRKGQVYGRWASLPTAPWQNAAWALNVEDDQTRDDLRLGLALAAKRYRQDSIAWTEGVTDFLTPPRPLPEERDRLERIDPS